MSKGSAPRPFSVSNEEYAKRWDAIFHKDEHDPEPVVEPVVQPKQHWGESPNIDIRAGVSRG